MTTTEHPTVLGTVRALPTTARVLILGVFVNNLTAFLNAFLVLFLVNRGFSAWHAGVALAALLVGRVFGTAVGGAIADRVGYRWTIVGSMTAAAVLVLCLVHAPYGWLAVGIAGVTGVCLQAYVPASTAWLVQLTDRRHQVMVFAVNRLAFNVGATVGPLTAALIISVFSYDVLFYADAAAATAFALIALLLLPPDRGTAAAPEPAAGSADATTGSAATGSATAPESAAVTDAAGAPESAAATGATAGPAAPERRGYRDVFADTRFMLFAAAMFLTAVAYIQMTAALPLFITGNGHSERVYAILLAVNGFVVIALELVFSRWTQRLPVGLPMAAGMALLGLGHLVYVGPDAISVLVLATVVWTLGEVVAAPSMMAYPGMVAPERLRARYIATATVPQQAGYALGPLVGVAAWQLWGNAVWVITAVCAGLAALLVAAGVGLRHDPTRHPDPAPTGPTDGDDAAPGAEAAPAAGPA
ncbi:MAG TPA: MFS transporter, partial [Pseudonocardiaceae bacterium]